MTQVQYYARRVAKSRGWEHSACLRTLRDYLRHTPPADFASAVEYIVEDALLKALWEAGLNSDMQNVVLRRLEELKARRE